MQLALFDEILYSQQSQQIDDEEGEVIIQIDETDEMEVVDDEALHLTQQHILDEQVVNDETDEVQQLDFDELLVAVVRLEMVLDELTLLDETDEMVQQIQYQVHL